MQDLTVTLVQSKLEWEDPIANRAAMEKHLTPLAGRTDLVVLPEMFTTGFTMNAAPLAETMAGDSVAWISAMAGRLGAAVTGSLIIREDGRYYNRLIWAAPDGSRRHYDKRHLFRMAEEDAVYAPGTRLLTVELYGWRIRPFVCYDLRFPIWSRNLGPAYDLAIFVANWPARRAAHWKTLLAARAIENQCYVVGVNRVGTDGNGIDYTGDSTALDPLGRVLWHRESNEAVETITLKAETLFDHRRTFPAWMDADSDLITPPSDT